MIPEGNESGFVTGSGAAAQRQPRRLSAEWLADGTVHAVAIVASLIAGTAMLALAALYSSTAEFVSLILYVGALLTVFSVSCAYNLWPQSPAKIVLRRFDHAAIYLLIAATYTPFLTQIAEPLVAIPLAIFVWLATVIGMTLKLLLPGRFDRLAVVFYLLIGWSGIIAIEPLGRALSPSTIGLMLAGGIVYSLGVIFFAWRGLRFQMAIWHGFVVVGAGLHFTAIAGELVFARIA